MGSLAMEFQDLPVLRAAKRVLAYFMYPSHEIILTFKKEADGKRERQIGRAETLTVFREGKLFH